MKPTLRAIRRQCIHPPIYGGASMLAKNTARPTPRADEDGYSYVVHMLGTAIPTAPDELRDIVAELHAVVEEVTGSKVDKPARPRMGFLP